MRMGAKRLNARRAVDEARAAVAAAPGSVDAHLVLAERLLEAGDWKRAIEAAEQALVVDPEHLDAYLLRGRAFVRGRKHAKAEEAFRAVLYFDPTSRRARRGVAVSLARRGRRAEAAALFAELAREAGEG
jgi:cytochrome c-type biogenesis protein CcmH/NrfG